MKEEMKALLEKMNAISNKALTESVKEGDNKYYAAKVGATVWGVGKSEQEAIKDAHKSIDEYYTRSAPSRNDSDIDAHLAKADKEKESIKVQNTTEKLYKKYMGESIFENKAEDEGEEEAEKKDGKSLRRVMGDEKIIETLFNADDKNTRVTYNKLKNDKPLNMQERIVAANAFIKIFDTITTDPILFRRLRDLLKKQG